ncbi:PREDICTED: uncharacterized protein LOC105364588 [Ceratosolen solmsi marchali]|uniref:Uncharacterized protein LOC105364588 n=1 Tax=Ceratosolen solmsi marchali TaxID=326594 RepID=A0AAJ6YMM6_9HYME|nr:PREDICTED: uncharacterized protein LOC105364588 [Ceratosolen solmsi marchali]
METVFLACISTLVPLIVALGIAFGIRHVWRKYKNRRNNSASGLPWYRGVCSREDTMDSLHHRPHAGSQIIQPPTQILSAQDLVNGLDGPRYICETEVMEQVALAAANVDYVSPGSHTSKNADGNIITLTLKNNHLIVETEERAVTMEDTRCRKYQDDGCSVIVEVPAGYQSDETDDVNRGSSDDMAARVTDQQALVHREEIPEDRSGAFSNTKLFGSTNTGLSQSDLSICSQGSVNPSYRYGNQLEYEAGHFGYPMYGAECDSIMDSARKSSWAATNTKWVEFDKSPDTENALLQDLKAQGSRGKDDPDYIPVSNRHNNNNNNNNKGYSQHSELSAQSKDSLEAKGSIATIVHSNTNLHINGAMSNKFENIEQEIPDIDLMIKGNEASSSFTKPVITGAILKDEVNLQEDTFQEQQRKLGNGTLTPEHKQTEQHMDKSIRSEPNNKEQNNVVTRPEGSAFVPSHKRSCSIPPRLIEESLEIERKKPLDIYSQIKTSTKSILPGLSPKFELLQNEISPVDDKES